MGTQKKSACQSCPWLIDRRNTYFKPDLLRRTVVADHLAERLHHCHSHKETFCTGHLAYLQATPEGIEGSMLGRMAIRLNILDPAAIPPLEVFNSLDEMLQDHEDMFQESNPIQ